MPAASTSPRLAAKLGIAPGATVVLLGAPRDWEGRQGLPDGVRVVERVAGRPDVVVCFVRSAAELGRRLPVVLRRFGVADTPSVAVWLAWPRRAAGHTSDLTDNLVRQSVLPSGLVDVKVAALGEDWSGLKFVWRRHLR